MIKLYGAPFTRAGRAVWMLEETGQPYELISKNPQNGETRSDEMLALNPNGHVPVLDDNGTVIWESMAVNLYLADKYQTLMPATAETRGAAYQWSFWAITEAEGPLLDILMHSMFLPEEMRDPGKAEAGYEAIKAPLAALEQSLQGKDYLLDDEFTVADLNVCSVLGFAAYIQYDFSPYPAIAGWLGRCNARPAAQKMVQLAQEAMAGD
ncbi:MAG TPA: glutathione S-transferase family protein [Gammaproteobacteria bacterium]|nr:glutathione S-transferase family protein [Gammaproteobacteria bacterium]